MNFPTTYFLNVALHAAVLSVFAAVILLTFRQARYRAVAAIAGLLAVGLVPWLTALHLAPAKTFGMAEISTRQLPVWTVVVLPAEIPTTVSTVNQPVSPAGFVFSDPLKSAIGLWVAGSVAGLLLLGIAWIRQRHWTGSLEAIDEVSWGKIQAITSSPPERSSFLLTNSNASPCVTGFRHSRVVLPRFLFADDSAVALGWAVRHELAHLRAGDSRWMLVLSLVRCLHWWNPFAYHLFSQWAGAREQLCDLAAAEIPASREGYGHFLVTMAGRIRRRAPMTVAMARRTPARRLRSRIVSLLEAEPGAEKPVGKRFVGLGWCVVLSCAGLVSCMKVGSGSWSGIVGAKTGAIVSHSETSHPSASDPYVPIPRSDREGAFQIRITAKLMVTSPDTNFGGGSCSDKGVKMIMKKFEKIGIATVATIPSVSASSGESTRAEAIFEVMESGHQLTERAARSSVPFVGIKLKSVPRLSYPGSLAVNLRQIVDYRYVPGVWHFDGANTKPPAGLAPDKIKIIKRTIDCGLLSGNTFVSLLGEIEPGKYLTLLTKAEIIDAKGRVLKFPE